MNKRSWKVFYRVAIIAGVLFGALNVYVFAPRNDIVEGVVREFIVAGSVFGIVVGGVTWVFIRKFSFSIWTFVLLGAVLGITAVVVGESIFTIMYNLPRGQWQRIQPFPGEIGEFVGGTCYKLGNGRIYVRDKSGIVYGYNCWQRGHCQWQRVENPIQEEDNGMSVYCEEKWRPQYRPPKYHQPLLLDDNTL